MKQFKVGDIVQIDEFSNEHGYVYEDYIDFDDNSKQGVSIITRSGDDLGGFSYQEQQHYLTLLKETDFKYDFISVLQLYKDFEEGLFDIIFNSL